ncbi:trans-2,3-enoyl-CoA reductase [Capsaspora owczarzaki ATCC 30864]|uniref:Trans-2,3-enoyl-CoA reductase n=1 Tax=Capsaspora owczarzaki (strain ATCC 30864) TaxID=595528 RepID=A0A0D2X515_CAPO3|nr:trans-2,3-enoyl-CoA reductase [Capsaspora owczarzaki ATCC 30864]KJE97019.1 trans-2,3-enoyl-CoA reductase [Capsaspora owczarzaki ATCC 30864]|eukprot:XP_004343380.1 trans-2,3-enoyl-CoA reductase [Capsaspora owczarzaki ATCC 30864]
MKISLETANGRTYSVASIEVPADATVAQAKDALCKSKKSLYPSRIAFKREPRGSLLKDSERLGSSDLKLFFKDLGPQIGYSTVFYTEYAGPLLVYLLFYIRPSIFYGQGACELPYSFATNVAALCWTFHYAKRLLETRFVHRFSHGTMPILNIFKNSGYYWGAAALVSYFINHPLYTAPDTTFVYIGLAGFIISEIGNFSIHWALRNLRPAGTTTRRIPVPTADPFTALFNLVSCPNYTYEVSSWFFFNVMTWTVGGVLFMLVGLAQMSQWALGKHRNYKKEFKDYPKGRKAILPFFL